MKQIKVFPKENQGIATQGRNDSSNSSFRLKKKIFMPLLIAVMTVTMNLQAQVRIGEDKAPEKGAILDLNSAAKGGLLLPNVEIVKLNEIPDDFTDSDVHGGPHEVLAGMIVYNTKEVAGEGIEKGLYVWDGAKWHPLKCGCGTEPTEPPCIATFFPSAPQYQTQVPKPDGSTFLTFLTYNLGANPELPVREQMKRSPLSHEDVTVYGGLFQWGRKDATHALRCANDSEHGLFFTERLYTSAEFNANGVLSPDNGKFVWGTQVQAETDGSNNLNDWIAYDDDANHYNPTYKMYPARWGNGGGLTTQHPAPAKTYADPCPAGFRVPTQYEWAMLIGQVETNESHLATDDYFTFPSTEVSHTNARNTNIVWVRVENGKTVTEWSTAGADPFYNTPNLCGYTLYSANEWALAASGYKNGTLSLTDTGAPTPLMFLPAAGRRYHQDGIVRDTGLGGYYWCNTVSGVASYHMFFNSNGVFDDGYNGTRAAGLSVRCVSEGL